MKCTTCGYETQPSAKFCVQCGTTIVTTSVPAGMAPLAAPSVTPRPAVPPLSPPPVSSTSATAARPAYTPPPAPAAAAAAPPVTPTATATSAPAAPATGSSIPLGLIAGVLVLFAVIGIGSFVAYKMLFPAEPKEVVTAPDASKAADSAPAQPATDAPKDGAVPAGTAAAGSTDNNMSSQQAPAATPAPDTAAAPPPSAPDAAKAAAAKAADAKAKAAASGKSDTPSISNAPAAPTPSLPRQAAAPVIAPAPQVDRWEQMRQAYEVCNKESLFDRLACNSRVGQQYCKGYWGVVPQCPAGAYGDRANN